MLSIRSEACCGNPFAPFGCRKRRSTSLQGLILPLPNPPIATSVTSGLLFLDESTASRYRWRSRMVIRSALLFETLSAEPPLRWYNKILCSSIFKNLLYNSNLSFLSSLAVFFLSSLCLACC